MDDETKRNIWKGIVITVCIILGIGPFTFLKDLFKSDDTPTPNPIINVVDTIPEPQIESEPTPSPPAIESTSDVNNQDDGVEWKQVWVECFLCHGLKECATCHGDGWCISTYSDGSFNTTYQCPVCHGNGWCTQCGGTGGHYEAQVVFH